MKLELLYVWINKSEFNLFEKCGFNFSPHYFFELRKDKNDECHLVCDNRKASVINIFDNHPISNITAIVGENGTGKTSLLKYIYSNLMPLIQFAHDNPDYNKYTEEQRQLNQSIWIFKSTSENDENIEVYHTLPHLSAEFDCILFPITEETITPLFDENHAYNDITKIYLTNSQYSGNPSGYSVSKTIEKICLSNSSLSVFQKKFFEGLLKLNNPSFPKEFSHLQYILMKTITSDTFQQVCDILYFNLLSERGLIEKYAGKVGIDLFLHFKPLIYIIEEENHDFIGSHEIKSKKSALYKSYFQFKKGFSENPSVHEYNVFLNLYINLLLEVAYTCFFDENDLKELKGIEGIKNHLKSRISDITHQQCKLYYEKAYTEIESFEKCLNGCTYLESSLPKYDMARCFGLILSHKDNKRYLEFLHLVNIAFGEGDSFVLKYLSVKNLGMSSGERAFQNLFSWLCLIPIFGNIDISLKNGLRTNLLILIDEFDLYLHPEWQRKMLNFFIEMTNVIFSDFNTQIIFATHSPIMLSDVPKLNTICIEKAGTGNVRVVKEIRKETFAANIYSLYDDSFYLDSSIGEFAENTINYIISALKPIEPGVYPKIEDILTQYPLLKSEKHIESMINIIGEPIIREKLMSMFICCKNNTEIEGIDAEIQRLTQRRNEILNQQR